MHTGNEIHREFDVHPERHEDARRDGWYMCASATFDRLILVGTKAAFCNQMVMQPIFEKVCMRGSFRHHHPSGSIPSISSTQVIDVDRTGSLDEREFKMLMALSLAPRSEEEEAEAAMALFQFFDADNSGQITLEEIMSALEGLGAHIDQAYLDATMYECFKAMKTELKKREFVQWMAFLEKKLAGNDADLGTGEGAV